MFVLNFIKEKINFIYNTQKVVCDKIENNMNLISILIILTTNFNPMANSYRSISKLVKPKEVSEGSGVTVKRIIGSSNLQSLDPFLMMDHAKILKPNGFPAHPHRGFETVSYIIRGEIMHEDFKNNYGELSGGDVQ